MKKQIAITLEQHRHTETIQHHGKLGEGFTSEEREIKTEYVITKMRNACIIDFGSNGPSNLSKIRVGDTLNEKQAEELARMKAYDVTIIA